jgi:hypothetical protein
LFRWRFAGLVSGEPYGDLYVAVVDDHARTISLTFNNDGNDIKQPTPGLGAVVLTYTRIDDSHLMLEGHVGAENLSVQLERVDASNMLLTTRGFHWITEQPFNR